MNAFLKVGPPPGVKLSGLEYGLFLHLCHRYDTREGFKSAYPGGDELRLASTMSRSAIENAISKLKAKGMITQVKKGRTGQRANYVPTYAISLLTNPESVAYINTLDNEVSPIRAESVSNTGIEGRLYEQRVSSPPVTISNKSIVSSNKYDSIRFNYVVLSALPERLRTINPGSNLEKLLDESDSLGISEEIRKLLSTNRWDNVEANAGGIVSKIIKDAIERKRSGQLVVAPTQVTPSPPPFEFEERVITPRSASTEALLEDFLKGVGRLPK